MANPDYATLLPLIANAETDEVRNALIAKCYVFNTILTDSEKQLFEYTGFGYLADNPDEAGTAYVGDYLGTGPSITTPDTGEDDDNDDSAVTGTDPTQQLSSGVALLSSTGKILLDSQGNLIRLSDIQFSLNEINSKLTNIS